MKLQVRISGLAKQRVKLVEYYLGPCADDKFIQDPRNEIRQYKPGLKNEITVTVNLPDNITIEQVANEVENLAFRIRKAGQ